MSSTNDFIAAQEKLNEIKDQHTIDTLKRAISTNARNSNNRMLWPDFGVDEGADADYDNINIFDEKVNDAVTPLVKCISERMNFPVNSVYLFALTAVASAMVKGVTYNRYGSKNVTSIYAVIAQPPGSGKSGVFGQLIDPIDIAFANYNEEQEKKKAPYLVRLEAAKKERKKAKSGESLSPAKIQEIEAYEKDIQECEDAISRLPTYVYHVSDATPEGLISLALSQGGLFNGLSEEQSLIDGITGDLYGNGTSSNTEAILKGFDGGKISRTRVGTGTQVGRVRGCIGILAQKRTVDKILQKSVDGNGLTERFFIMNEPHQLAKKVHTVEGNKGIPLSILSPYINLMNSIVYTDDLTLEFCNKSLQLVCDSANKYVPLMADGESYSSSLMQGMASKINIRITKVACVLHVLKNWKGKDKPETIDPECTKRAVLLCEEMMKAFEKSASDGGYIGEAAERDLVIEKLTARARRSVFEVTPAQLRDAVKGYSIMSDIPKLTAHLKSNVLPELEKNGYCVMVNKKIYINPKLSGA
tara:strand:+ start:3307 stop:4896 length:1590 start_codon:yes stop_codon:yes gene_type:complete